MKTTWPDLSRLNFCLLLSREPRFLAVSPAFSLVCPDANKMANPTHHMQLTPRRPYPVADIPPLKNPRVVRDVKTRHLLMTFSKQVSRRGQEIPIFFPFVRRESVAAEAAINAVNPRVDIFPGFPGGSVLGSASRLGIRPLDQAVTLPPFFAGAAGLIIPGGRTLSITVRPLQMISSG